MPTPSDRSTHGESLINRRHVLGLGGAGLALAALPAVPAHAASRNVEPDVPLAAVRSRTFRPATAKQVAAARQYAPVSPRVRHKAQVRRGFANQVKTAKRAGAVTVDIDFQYQETGYWCGPAATRHALSARGVAVSQQQMANELPTSENGTDWIGQVTRVLTSYVGWYETKEMPNDPPTNEQRDLLWHDVMSDLDGGYAVVTNIVAPPNNHPPGYPDTTIWHYFTVIGYNPDNKEVLIADSAGFADTATYWLTFDQLATLIPPKGYSA